MNDPILIKIADVMALTLTGAATMPTVIDAVHTSMSLLRSGADPTDVQMAQIDAALDAAHTALQRS